MPLQCTCLRCGKSVLRSPSSLAKSGRVFCSPQCGFEQRRSERMDLFWSQVDKDGPIPIYRPDLGNCWIWTGPVNEAGYGRTGIGHISVFVHRLSYTVLVGLIPEGLHLDHLCRVVNCARDTHLEPVTNKVNCLRGFSSPAMNARKTHCVHGHCQWRIRIDGSRVCIPCALERSRKHNGTKRPGVHGTSKVDLAAAIAIRERRQRGELSRDLAREFGLHITSIQRIVRGESWGKPS